jgi:hypothetical protein
MFDVVEFCAHWYCTSQECYFWGAIAGETARLAHSHQDESRRGNGQTSSSAIQAENRPDEVEDNYHGGGRQTVSSIVQIYATYVRLLTRPSSEARNQPSNSSTVR